MCTVPFHTGAKLKHAQHSSTSDVIVRFPNHEHAEVATSTATCSFGSCLYLVPDTEMLQCEHAYAADSAFFLRIQEGSSHVSEVQKMEDLNMQWVGRSTYSQPILNPRMGSPLRLLLLPICPLKLVIHTGKN
jgi:hypothetical protein